MNCNRKFNFFDPLWISDVIWQVIIGWGNACRLVSAKSSPARMLNSWWCQQIETFSTSLAICPWNSPVTGIFPTQMAVTRSFDVFFDLRLNKRLSKLECGTWYHHPRRLQCVFSRNLRIFKVATWHYWCRHHLKNNCIWDDLQCCLLFCS